MLGGNPAMDQHLSWGKEKFFSSSLARETVNTRCWPDLPFGLYTYCTFTPIEKKLSDLYIQAKTNARKVRHFSDILAPLSRETKIKNAITRVTKSPASLICIS